MAALPSHSDLARYTVVDRAVRALRIVPLAVCLNDYACFAPAGEPLHVEAFITKATVEALDGSVLPRLSRLCVGNLDVFARRPFSHLLRYELGSIVTTQICGPTIDADQPVQSIDDCCGTKSRLDIDGQTFARELVLDHKALQFLAVRAFIVDKVEGPYRIGLDCGHLTVLSAVFPFVCLSCGYR